MKHVRCSFALLACAAIFAVAGAAAEEGAVETASVTFNVEGMT